MNLNALIKLFNTKKRGFPLVIAIVVGVVTLASQNKSISDRVQQSLCSLFKSVLVSCQHGSTSADDSTQDGSALTGEVLGKVVHVDDGDTLVLLTKDGAKKKIRLSDIDAPETGHGSHRPGQRHAEASKKHLSTLVLDQSVQATCFGSGGFGRSACLIFMNGVNVNHELVRKGLAWANRQNKRYVRDKQVFTIEDEAKAARLGIWSTEDAVAPWIWRQRCWKEKQCD